MFSVGEQIKVGILPRSITVWFSLKIKKLTVQIIKSNNQIKELSNKEYFARLQILSLRVVVGSTPPV